MSHWWAAAQGLLTAPAVLADDDAIQVFGVTLVGVSKTTGVKLLFTLTLIAAALLLRYLVLRGVRRVLGGDVADPRRFWARQGLQ